MEEEICEQWYDDADEAYERMREDNHDELEECVGDMCNAFVSCKDVGYYRHNPERFAKDVINMLCWNLKVKVFIDEFNNVKVTTRDRLNVKCDKCGYITDTSQMFRDYVTNGHLTCNKCNDGSLKLFRT